MNSLMQTVHIKLWQAILLLASTGFAFGTVLSRMAEALGF